jgi:hypothetical protein
LRPIKQKLKKIMKKTITQITLAILLPAITSAQVLINNGPLINSPGAGAGGANVSNLHSGITTFGFGHAVATGFRVAEDFTVPAGTTWNIDSIIFFAYQTGSTTTSTMNHVNWSIWDNSPAAGGQIILGDTTANDLDFSYWSGIYRTTDVDLTNTQRPIMANRIATSGVGLSLGAGTYWIAWQTGGTLTSGPWAPPITITGVTNTGNAIQFNPNTGVWADLVDGTLLEPQGLPFIMYGTAVTGINENQFASGISINPNPASEIMAVRVIGASAPVSIEVMNVHGQVVYSAVETRSTFAHNINVSKWSKGVYMVILTSGEKKENRKVVIE